MRMKYYTGLTIRYSLVSDWETVYVFALSFIDIFYTKFKKKLLIALIIQW